MTRKRDLGGHEITDYSNSPMAPDRKAKLNLAEIDYVNGILNPEESDSRQWPSYRELAEKYEIPLRVVQEQATKYSWGRRREAARTALIIYQNEQTRKRWRATDEVITNMMSENLSNAMFISHRLLHEHKRMCERAWAEEQAAVASGDITAVVRAGAPTRELEAVVRAIESLTKSQDRVNARMQALPTLLPDNSPPEIMPTAEEEQAQLEAASTKDIPDATLLEIYQVIERAEAARASRRPSLIEGEVEYDDDDEEGHNFKIEKVSGE